MKTPRHRASMRPTARRAGLSLAAVTLILAAICRADDMAVRDPRPAADTDAPAAAAEAAAPDPVTPRFNHHHAVRRFSVAQSIDESVRRLARGLDLDAGQQTRLREILVNQHRQVMLLRNGAAAASGDVTGATMAIYDQTRARIRAMLNDEQLKKYPAALPRDQTAPAQADLQKWLQMQDSKRTQNDGVPH